jgi:hypothetical protein
LRSTNDGPEDRSTSVLIRTTRSTASRHGETTGISTDTIRDMAMTLRLTEDETEALRERARREGRSMQEVARAAVRGYIEHTSRRELLEQVLDEDVPRYAEALKRLGE